MDQQNDKDIQGDGERSLSETDILSIALTLTPNDTHSHRRRIVQLIDDSELDERTFPIRRVTTVELMISILLIAFLIFGVSIFLLDADWLIKVLTASVATLSVSALLILFRDTRKVSNEEAYAEADKIIEGSRRGVKPHQLILSVMEVENQILSVADRSPFQYVDRHKVAVEVQAILHNLLHLAELQKMRNSTLSRTENKDNLESVSSASEHIEDMWQFNLDRVSDLIAYKNAASKFHTKMSQMNSTEHASDLEAYVLMEKKRQLDPLPDGQRISDLSEELDQMSDSVVSFLEDDKRRGLQ